MASFLLRTAAAVAAFACVATRANAQQPSVPHPAAYGILVGTNAGGGGQKDLRYAEDDARKMAEVLRDLGRYGNADLKVLVKPDVAAVLAAIDGIAPKLQAHAAKGEQAIVVFYYSGHAKANAFNLGSEELAITLLRERLAKLPATLTLVVLDACQSGQFARTKGAEPAADFSFNSVSRLTTRGLAVIASSSAQELSQESDELRGSYFTHHLITALRGAADADGDGRVSLDEAYRYAYRHTLTSTAQTQIGSQHVTFETDLGGQGDVPVTYPAAAKSQLELGADLEGRVLVQHKASGNVVAEVQKAKGAPLRLAFASGAYDAIVRAGSPVKVSRCRVALLDDRVTPLDLSSCEELKAAPVLRKGVEEPDVHRLPSPPVEPLQVEGGVGVNFRTEDGYTRRLNEFGYAAEAPIVGVRSPHLRASLGVSKGLIPHLALGVQLHTLTGDEYRRNVSSSEDRFSWDAYGLSGFVRASSSPLGSGKTSADLYGIASLGLTLGATTLTTGSVAGGPTETTRATHGGFVIGGFGGVHVTLGRVVGLFFQGGYEYAPTITNQLGETHDSGGPSVQSGLRFKIQGGPR